jgi:hypothetical protein
MQIVAGSPPPALMSINDRGCTETQRAAGDEAVCCPVCAMEVTAPIAESEFPQAWPVDPDL